jgi:hypothetical protein
VCNGIRGLFKVSLLADVSASLTVMLYIPHGSTITHSLLPVSQQTEHRRDNVGIVRAF